MQFVKIENAERAANELAVKLKAALEEFPAVTWLIPGGSNIAISVAAMELLDDDLTKKLILAQTDERYGEIGHKDSNWQQLKDAGFNFKQAKSLPILRSPKLSLADTAAASDKVIGELIKRTYTIGQFGVGEDGHIAGIKPDSPASVASGLVVGYEWTDFTRITLTFSAIRQLNQVLVFMFGAAKKPTLETLANEQHQPITQPMQILKSARESIIYNDQIGAEA